MRVALTKESHENFFLQEGHLLALQFKEGWVCVRIKGKEASNIKPYQLGAVAAASELSSWDEIKDSEARYLLQPPSNNFIHHFFWGINYPAAQVYFQYPSRRNRWSMIAVERVLGGDIGYVDGDMSPYEGPFSVKSEIFTVYDLYPAFQCHNPLNDAMANVLLNFDAMRYTYQIIKTQAMIREILVGERRARKHTVGGADPMPAEIPKWLKDLVGDGLLKMSLDIMEAA